MYTYVSKGGIKMYEYKFVRVPFKRKLKDPMDASFERVKEIITEEAKNGWRLKQVVIPANEKTGVYGAFCYEVILEKEIV